jgi:hypothetical protein
MIAVELLLAGGIQHFLFFLFFAKSSRMDLAAKNSQHLRKQKTQDRSAFPIAQESKEHDKKKEKKKMQPRFRLVAFREHRWQVTFRLTATLRELELSSLGKIENVLETERLAS